jgi:hypothetical protein
VFTHSLNIVTNNSIVDLIMLLDFGSFMAKDEDDVMKSFVLSWGLFQFQS